MDPSNSTLKNYRGAHRLVRCHVLAKREHIARLELEMPGETASSVTLHAIEPHEQVLPEILGHAQCIVLEVDPADRLSLARMEQVRRTRPAVPVIAAIENADFNLTRLLVRQGVFDVVALPFDAEELHSRIMDAGATLAAKADNGLAPMVAIASPLGGVGATTVVTHLAAAISRHAGEARPCCVVDLDMQFGDVANYLGVKPATSVLELLESGERLDGDLVRDAAVDTGRGAFVLAAPEAISPLEEVNVDHLLRLLEIARREFGFVLLDLPANWTNWTLSAVFACSDVLLLTDQTINALRRTKRCLEMLKHVELPSSDVGILVNRFERRMLQNIGTDDVSRALGCEVRATLALEKNGLSEAQDQGLLLDEVARKARFSRDVAELADGLCNGMMRR